MIKTVYVEVLTVYSYEVDVEEDASTSDSVKQALELEPGIGNWDTQDYEIVAGWVE